LTKSHRISDLRPDIGKKASDLADVGTVTITSIVAFSDWGKNPVKTMVTMMIKVSSEAEPELYHANSEAIVRDLRVARAKNALPLDVEFTWKTTSSGFDALVFGDGNE
jgi:hypothetical protein